MSKLALVFVVALSAAACPSQVLLGVDVLQRDGCRALDKKRVGLVTNHTGRDSRGMPSIDVLAAGKTGKLVALFSPEHGIRGMLDEKVKDSTDEKTGLPVWSLYGEARKPTPAQLEGVDALVYDIQDIGARFYTYISTLRLCLEAAGERKIPLVVLDRPNPIDGVHVEGPLRDDGAESFTATHRLPVRHGMTVGELATMFVAERKIPVELVVVRMEGWRRPMRWDATGLEWRNPSPNMRSLTEAMLYPGIGLLETTNVSVGRGTGTPFEVIGAPWCDGKVLAAELARMALRGVTFIPVRFTPSSSKHAGVECGGINVAITDWAQFEPVRVGVAIAIALRATHAPRWQDEHLGKLLAHERTLTAVRAGAALDTVVAQWTDTARAFLDRREPYLLYREPAK